MVKKNVNQDKHVNLNLKSAKKSKPPAISLYDREIKKVFV